MNFLAKWNFFSTKDMQGDEGDTLGRFKKVTYMEIKVSHLKIVTITQTMKFA